MTVSPDASPSQEPVLSPSKAGQLWDILCTAAQPSELDAASRRLSQKTAAAPTSDVKRHADGPPSSHAPDDVTRRVNHVATLLDVRSNFQAVGKSLEGLKGETKAVSEGKRPREESSAEASTVSQVPCSPAKRRLFTKSPREGGVTVSPSSLAVAASPFVGKSNRKFTKSPGRDRDSPFLDVAMTPKASANRQSEGQIIDVEEASGLAWQSQAFRRQWKAGAKHIWQVLECLWTPLIPARNTKATAIQSPKRMRITEGSERHQCILID